MLNVTNSYYEATTCFEIKDHHQVAPQQKLYTEMSLSFLTC
jgi:hypothetical protein